MTLLNRRSAMAAILPIVAAPGLASAISTPDADPAMEQYQAVMDRHEGMQASDTWDGVEEWCQAECAALLNMAEDVPPGLRPLLRRVVVMVDRMEEASPNFMDEEVVLFREIGRRAQAMLEGWA